MKNITDYIDIAFKRSGAKSDRKFCDLMRVNPTWVNATRKGKLPTDENMLKLAELAGIPPHIALLDLNVWRSKGKTQAVYKRLIQAVETVSLSAFVFFISSAPALASSSNDEALYYILRKRRGVLINCFLTLLR